jgi:hypothetical protein
MKSLMKKNAYLPLVIENRVHGRLLFDCLIWIAKGQKKFGGVHEVLKRAPQASLRHQRKFFAII